MRLAPRIVILFYNTTMGFTKQPPLPVPHSKKARGPTHEERVHGSWAVNEEEATVAARRRPLFGSAPALICWL